MFGCYVAYLLTGVAVAGAPLTIRLAQAADGHPFRPGDLAVSVGYALVAVALWPYAAWTSIRR